MFSVKTLFTLAMMASTIAAATSSYANDTATKDTANDGLDYDRVPASILAILQHEQPSELHERSSKCQACDGIPDCLAYCIEASRQNPTCQKCATLVGAKKLDACLICLGVPI